LIPQIVPAPMAPGWTIPVVPAPTSGPMSSRAEVAGAPPGAIGTNVTGVTPMAAVGPPDTSVAPVTVGPPETEMVDLAAVGTIPLTVLPVGTPPMLLQIVKAVRQVLMSLGKRSAISGRPALARAALPGPHARQSLSCRSRARPPCSCAPLSRSRRPQSRERGGIGPGSYPMSRVNSIRMRPGAGGKPWPTLTARTNVWPASRRQVRARDASTGPQLRARADVQSRAACPGVMHEVGISDPGASASQVSCRQVERWPA
jgi:hypothetical protein